MGEATQGLLVAVGEKETYDLLSAGTAAFEKDLVDFFFWWRFWPRGHLGFSVG